MSIELLGIQALHGIVYGMILFLISAGLSVVMGLMRITNVAHGSFYMLGTYLTVAILASGASFWLALFVVPILLFALGASTERVLLRHAKSHFNDLLLTLSLFMLVNEIVLWVWGAQPLPVPEPGLLSGSFALPFGRYPIYRLFVLASSTVLSILLLYLFLRTLAGVKVRAVVSDPGMAEALGINTSRVRMIVFGAGTALAGLAGCLSGPIFQADPSLASTSLMSMFIVVVLGGFGSVTGALIASLAMGQVQTWSIVLLPDMAAAGPLLLFIAVLALRPQGLLGERT
jgi:branched-chain amino acid transport system permease protein